MGCYYTLYLNTYGYSLLFYKVSHEEGECRQLEFWLEKEQTLETYSAQLQKSWNFTEVIFGINKKYWAEEIHQGGTPCPRRWEVRPLPRGPPGGSPMTIFSYMKSFVEKKIEATFRDETPPPWGKTLADPI